MAPFTRWLPPRPDQACDLVITIADDRVSDLLEGMNPFAKTLADQGYAMIAEARKLGGVGPRSLIRVRVSTEPLTSTGEGCDILAYLPLQVPEPIRLGLQRGSVVLWESRSIPRSPDRNFIPDGVILYPVPFRDLSLRVSRKVWGKELVATGVLTHLLGLPPEAVRDRVCPASHLPFFDAGLEFAREHLAKRDVFALTPPSAVGPRVILNADQALVLGLGIGECACGPACIQRLDRSPESWIAEHLSSAWKVVSFLKNPRYPGVRIYRGPQGAVVALLRSPAPTAVRTESGARPTLVLVAADLADALFLVGAGYGLGGRDTEKVWVVVDDFLADRRESVPVAVLRKIMREAAQQAEGNCPSTGPAQAGLLKPERGGDPRAEIGYVAWGTAQGVVREAVMLCRRFGLSVAGLYPKVLRPVPTAEIESFAASVRHLVLVEPNPSGQYSNLLRTSVSVPFSTIAPEAGRPLTPMDIFMREGLGAIPRD